MMVRTMKARWIGGAFLVLPLVLGCSWGKDRGALEGDPIALLREGHEKLAKGRYEAAREVYQRIQAQDARKAYGALTQIRIADTYYGEALYEEARAEYEKFLNLYPYNRLASYAQYQLGMCFFNQMDTVDRNPEFAQKALEAFETLLSRYPQSPYAEEARIKIALCKAHLAAYEYYVGMFYFKAKAYQAAAGRFEYLIQHYPRSQQEPDALYHLALSYQALNRPRDAQSVLNRLLSRYPDTSYRSRANRLLSQLADQE